MDDMEFKFCTAKACQFLDDIEDQLGSDRSLAGPITMIMLACLANEKEIPSFKILRDFRALRGLFSIKRI